VFIGQHMDKEKVIAELNQCLINNEEMEAYKNQQYFEDPFNQVL
jgi:hypothetical protein